MSCFGLISDIARGWRHNCCRMKYLGREPDGFDWAYVVCCRSVAVESLFVVRRWQERLRMGRFEVPGTTAGPSRVCSE